MDAELSKLETQIAQVVDLCEKLKVENRSIKMRLSRLEADNRSMSDKIRAATQKLEELIVKLPEE